MTGKRRKHKADPDAVLERIRTRDAKVTKSFTLDGRIGERLERLAADLSEESGRPISSSSIVNEVLSDFLDDVESKA
jgi:predicted DNA-binding protein